MDPLQFDPQERKGHADIALHGGGGHAEYVTRLGVRKLQEIVEAHGGGR